MRQTEILIKWIGSKRLQSEEIFSYFPDKIKTYYEPFLGGGSMMFVLASSDLPVEKLVCSDLNEPLINLWKIIQSEPKSILEAYQEMWDKLGQQGQDFYYQVRSEFNRDQDPIKFFFLLRTCRNGLIRFNKKKEFNTAFHFKRRGIRPDKLAKVLDLWHQVLNRKPIEFKCCDYQEVQSEEGDYIYLDPPYATPKDQLIYYGMLEYELLWSWMRKQPANYSLSLNGFKDNRDCRLQVPSDLFRQQVLISNGWSKLDQLHKNRVRSYDSLYVK